MSFSTENFLGMVAPIIVTRHCFTHPLFQRLCWNIKRTFAFPDLLCGNTLIPYTVVKVHYLNLIRKSCNISYSKVG